MEFNHLAKIQFGDHADVFQYFRHLYLTPQCTRQFNAEN